jgi:uroporphyrinogen decarboxylase
MKSRERVLNSINHKPVDRVPIDLGVHFSTGISAFAYHNLRKFLGLSTDNIKVPDMVQFLARVDEDILEKFHCDCMLLQPGFKGTKKWQPRGGYEFLIAESVNPYMDSKGNWIVERGSQAMRMPKGGFFFDGDWLSVSDYDEEEKLQRIAAEAERIYKDTDYFTMYMGYYGYFQPTNFDWQCKMLTDPEEIIEEQERVHEAQIKSLGKLINKAGNYIQAIEVNSDLGSQRGPFCRPSLYEELCAPYLKRLCDFVHKNSDMKVFLHCCGSIEPLIPILIDCGVDIINPVQISAENMNPEHLKKQYGDKITFWGGGCNTQQILNLGSPEDVRQNVRELMGAFKPNGGFIFNQVHNIMGDIKPENIVAMFDEAYKNSFY